jgi:hypothetical protein
LLLLAVLAAAVKLVVAVAQVASSLVLFQL